jgi:hypothetical protein
MWFVLPAALAGPVPFAGADGVVRADGAAGGDLAIGVASAWERALAVEVEARGGFTTAGPLVAARVDARWWLADPADGALGVRVGGGPLLDERGVGALGLAGVSLSVPTSTGPWVRVDADVDLDLHGVDAVRLGVRLAPRRRPEPPPPVVEATPAPAGPASITPPDALVWVPHPVCAWATAAEAGALLATIGVAGPLEVRAPGYLPARLDALAGPVALERAPEQGALLVVAAPGDVIRWRDASFEAAADGVAQLSLSPGPVALSIVGNGRSTQVEAYVGDGHVTWVRVPPPPPLELRFAVGADGLDPEELERLRGFAALAGGGRFRVVGQASPEGDPLRNHDLADRRAMGARDALVAAGVPADTIEVLPSLPSRPDLDASVQRRVVVSPVTTSP